jgi:hypothetical protein
VWVTGAVCDPVAATSARRELVRRDYATTRDSYLRIVKAFHRRTGGRLDRIGPDDLRRYQVYLLEERKLAVGTVVAEVAALRSFCLRVLKRNAKARVDDARHLRLVFQQFLGYWHPMGQLPDR